MKSYGQSYARSAQHLSPNHLYVEAHTWYIVLTLRCLGLGVKPDTISYNALLGALAREGGLSVLSPLYHVPSHELA